MNMLLFIIYELLPKFAGFIFGNVLGKILGNVPHYPGYPVYQLSANLEIIIIWLYVENMCYANRAYFQFL